MIDLDWFEQYSYFNSFHFVIRYEDIDVDFFSDLNLCSTFLTFDFCDAFSFIRDFLNANFLVTRFESSIKEKNLFIYIAVQSL